MFENYRFLFYFTFLLHFFMFENFISINILSFFFYIWEFIIFLYSLDIFYNILYLPIWEFDMSYLLMIEDPVYRKHVSAVFSMLSPSRHWLMKMQNWICLFSVVICPAAVCLFSWLRFFASKTSPFLLLASFVTSTSSSSAACDAKRLSLVSDCWLLHQLTDVIRLPRLHWHFHTPEEDGKWFGDITFPSPLQCSLKQNTISGRFRLKSGLPHHLKRPGGILMLSGDQRDHRRGNRIHPRTRTAHYQSMRRIWRHPSDGLILYTPALPSFHPLFSFSLHSSCFCFSLLALLLQKNTYLHL